MQLQRTLVYGCDGQLRKIIEPDSTLTMNNIVCIDTISFYSYVFQSSHTDFRQPESSLVSAFVQFMVKFN